MKKEKILYHGFFARGLSGKNEKKKKCFDVVLIFSSTLSVKLAAGLASPVSRTFGGALIARVREIHWRDNLAAGLESANRLSLVLSRIPLPRRPLEE